ncbi:MAG: hypothetical protein RMJ54_13705 [Roseiflexaceae bacterium]|nr:hypothetical protein [Roseiflexus sp.]MDW8233828.1 hypothetical protein [Roseiflexaceae bacterium]
MVDSLPWLQAMRITESIVAHHGIGARLLCGYAPDMSDGVWNEARGER